MPGQKKFEEEPKAPKAASLNFVRADVDGLKGFLRVFTRKGQVNVFGKRRRFGYDNPKRDLAAADNPRNRRFLIDDLQRLHILVKQLYLHGRDIYRLAGYVGDEAADFHFVDIIFLIFVTVMF